MNYTRILAPLIAANSVSGFAQGITMFAIPWYLVHNLNEGKFLNFSLMGIITMLSLFWSMYSGTLIDRYNRKRIFQVLNFTDFIILSVVSAYGFLNQELPFLLIAAIAMTTIFTFNVHFPNMYAFVQELFPPVMYPKVNSGLELQHQTVNFFGMVAGGMLITGTENLDWWPGWFHIEKWDLWEVFMMDGITYLASFILLSLIPYSMKDRKVDLGTVTERLRMGISYLMENKPLLIFGCAGYVVFVILMVFIQTLLPVYVNDYLDEEGIVMTGWDAIYSLGAVFIGFMVMRTKILPRINLIRAIIVFNALTALILIIYSLTKSVSVFLILAFLIGITNAGTRIFRVTYVLRIVPNRVVGRVSSIFHVFNTLARAILIFLFMLPFFSGEENGDNVVYAMAILALVTFAGFLALALNFSKFDQEAAKG